MAPDEEDLYDEEFDFVDDDDEADEDAGEEEADDEFDEDIADDEAGDEQEVDEDDEDLDEYGRPEQAAANYVVHVYEYKKFKRTIDRAFTPEDAEAFATEYNRTAKSYGRTAIIGKNDLAPRKTLS